MDPDPSTLARLSASCFSVLEPSLFPAGVLPRASNCVSFTEQQLWAPGKAQENHNRGRKRTGWNRLLRLHHRFCHPLPTRFLKIGFVLLLGGRSIHLGNFVFENKKMENEKCSKSRVIIPFPPPHPHGNAFIAKLGDAGKVCFASAPSTLANAAAFWDTLASGAEALSSEKFPARALGLAGQELSWENSG